MALRLEKAFGVGMDLLLPMQAGYDAAQIRGRSAEIDVRRYHPDRAGHGSFRRHYPQVFSCGWTRRFVVSARCYCVDKPMRIPETTMLELTDVDSSETIRELIRVGGLKPLNGSGGRGKRREWSPHAVRRLVVAVCISRGGRMPLQTGLRIAHATMWPEEPPEVIKIVDGRYVYVPGRLEDWALVARIEPDSRIRIREGESAGGRMVEWADAAGYLTHDFEYPSRRLGPDEGRLLRREIWEHCTPECLGFKPNELLPGPQYRPLEVDDSEAARIHAEARTVLQIEVARILVPVEGRFRALRAKVRTVAHETC